MTPIRRNGTVKRRPTRRRCYLAGGVRTRRRTSSKRLKVTATDSDAGDSVTDYTIEGGADQSKFSIVSATGVLTFGSALSNEEMSMSRRPVSNGR